jgi:hypothetical protein
MVDSMSEKKNSNITFKGRSLGIVVLTSAQLMIGTIHVLFGLSLLAFENIAFLQTTAVYDIYSLFSD